MLFTAKHSAAPASVTRRVAMLFVPSIDGSRREWQGSQGESNSYQGNPILTA